MSSLDFAAALSRNPVLFNRIRSLHPQIASIIITQLYWSAQRRILCKCSGSEGQVMRKRRNT